MSDIIIKNPENLAIDPRMEYVIRCVKEVVTKRGDDPRSVTGFVRGKAFYGELSHAMSDATVLDWADSQFIFHDDEYIHGLQLYDTVTGIYLGIVSIFDISALHHSQHPECVSAGCAHGGKQDSIVIAITSKAVRRRARSQLQMNNGLGGSFSDSTNMISVKNLTSLTHKGDKWYGKGVGKRILSTIDSILSTVLFGNLPADDRHLGMTRGALRSSVGNFTREYRDAVAEFFDHIDTSKYNPATAQSILPEFIFDKDFMATFISKESEAIAALKKPYEVHDRFFNIFKDSVKRVVCHDLTTDVVTFYSDWPTKFERSYFPNLDSFINENASASEKIAVLNIGLQSDGDMGAYADLGPHDPILNYIPNVGLGRYEKPATYDALLKGGQDGQVFYFLDDNVKY